MQLEAFMDLVEDFCVELAKDNARFNKDLFMNSLLNGHADSI